MDGEAVQIKLKPVADAIVTSETTIAFAHFPAFCIPLRNKSAFYRPSFVFFFEDASYSNVPGSKDSTAADEAKAAYQGRLDPR
jgi:hypothetical protein